MKILQVVHGFPPFSNAGAEKYTHQLSSVLVQENEVHVLYPRKQSGTATISSRKDEDFGYIRHEIAIQAHFNPSIKNIAQRTSVKGTYRNEWIEEQFTAFLEKLAPDIVHFQHVVNMSAELIQIVKDRGIPVVLTLHDYWFLCPTVQLVRYDGEICSGPVPAVCRKCWSRRRGDRFANRNSSFIPEQLMTRVASAMLSTANADAAFALRRDYLRKIMAEVDVITAPSRFLRETYIRSGIPEDKIIYMELGYEQDNLLQPQPANKSARTVFGFIGRIAPVKGVDVLVEAFLRVPAELAELRIYGGIDRTKPYGAKLHRMVEDVSHIQFMGLTNDVATAFTNMDVLVFPSVWYENCPLVLAERLLMKKPVLASNIGAIPEFVMNGVDGLLFEPGNADDLYKKLMSMIGDPRQIQQMEAQIHRMPPTIQRQTVKMVQIYLSLLDGSD